MSSQQPVVIPPIRDDAYTQALEDKKRIQKIW
jgi:hypothetical protein